MRFAQVGSTLATHVGSVADVDPPDPRDPPETEEVVVMDGLTFVEYTELGGLVTVVGTVGETFNITLGTTVTDLTVQITITPVVADGTEVNWGDGTPVEYSPPATSHTYAAAGTYTITADPFGPGEAVSSEVTVTTPAAPPAEPETEPEPEP